MPPKGYRISNPSYVTVHIWVRKDRGSPDLYPCHFCGGKANQWACIDNKTLREKRPNGWVTYSPDTNDYAPSCARCNTISDRAPKGTCKNGHDEWYLDNKGGRHCRPCTLTRMKKYYEKNLGIE